jgi:hypothetical protein
VYDRTIADFLAKMPVADAQACYKIMEGRQDG